MGATLWAHSFLSGGYPLSATPRFPRSPQRPRRGSTIVEQLVVLAVLAVVSTLMLGSGIPLFHAAAVETATRETADLLAYARDYAVASSTRTAVRFDGARTRVIVHAGPDTIARGDFSLSGVHLSATRDSLAYAPSGLGVGASNLRVVLSLGTRADTITVSRLGRVSVQ